MRGDGTGPRDIQAPFRAALEQMLEPVCICRAVRDEGGRIEDFEVVFRNRAAAATLPGSGRSRGVDGLRDLVPSHRRSALMDQCARLVEGREPLVIEDLEYVGSEGGEAAEPRIFDVRLSPLEDGLVATWVEVTYRRQHERALERLRRRYELVARATNDIIWDWDLRTGRLRWNEGLRQILGYDLGDVEESLAWWSDRIHPDDRARVLESLREAVRGGAERWTGEYRFRTAREDWAEVLDRGYIDRDAGGRARRMIGAMLDVTERSAVERERLELLRLEREARAEAEQALGERAELLAELESIYQSAPVSLCVVDRDLRFLRANERMAENNGLSAEQHIGRTIREVIPSAPEELEPRLLEIFRTGEPTLDLELLGETPARPGVERHWINHWIPIRGSDGAVKAVNIVVEEVTEQRSAERVLIEAARRQRLLAQVGNVMAAPTSVEDRLHALAALLTSELCDLCIIDLVEPGGQVARPVVLHRDEEWRDAAAELRRWTPGAENSSQMARVLGDGEPLLIPELTDELLRSTLDDPRHLEVARSLPLSSAVIVPLVARGRAVAAATLFSMDPDQTFSPSDVELVRDLAERAALSIDNARLYEEARQAVQDREQVLATVSHDLRSPLGAIGMAASILSDDALPRGVRDKQGVLIEQSIAQALDLVEDLLDASRLRSGRMTLRRSAESPAGLIADAVAMAEGSAERKRIELAAKADLDLPDVSVERRRVLQVLGNIIGNALRHTPEGGTVTVSARTGDEGVRFEVADTGPGLEPSEAAQVFDRFWRGQERRGDRGAGGAGLGLSIAKGLVEAHGGTIGVDSSPGAGARFWFELPTVQQDGD